MRKKVKVDILTIPIPLYRISVVIFIGADIDFIVKHGIKHHIEKSRFSKDWKRWVEDNMRDGTGIMCDFGDNNKDVIVWVSKRPEKLSEYAILYHELYHATDHIAKSRNFNTEDKTSEPRAYLFEYLFTEVSKVLWNKN